MTLRHMLALALAAAGSVVMSAPALAQAAVATATAEGVLKVKSAYPFDQTVERLKADIAAKGIRFFIEIDQGQLATGANLSLPNSKLLIFGNPPLGVQFLTSNRLAGLDWPVRMLVTQEADGTVWVAWTDFAFIARRYGLTDREQATAMATMVANSIASSVTRS